MEGTSDDLTRRRRSMDRSARVLIIDDNPSTLLSLKTFLEDHGYESICANSGREALDMIQHHPPDLILLDVILETPYSGFHICSSVKADPHLRHIPVIGISGMSERLGIRYCPETDRAYFNPDAYLEKPIDFGALLERIQSLLQSS